MNKKLFALSITIDLAFLFVLGFATRLLLDSILDTIVVMSSGISQALQQNTPLLTALAQNPYTTKLAITYLALFATTYLIWTLFQGTNWWIAFKIEKETKKYKQYLWQFAKKTIPLAIIYGLIHLATLGLDIIKSLATKQTTTSAGIIPIIILGYFATTAYAKGTYLSKKTIIPYLKIILATAIFWITINTIQMISQTIAIIIGLIILIPAFTIARIKVIQWST